MMRASPPLRSSSNVDEREAMNGAGSFVARRVGAMRELRNEKRKEKKSTWQSTYTSRGRIRSNEKAGREPRAIYEQ